MPYFRNNRFSLFNRERRKGATYFHATTSSRWFGSLVVSWKGKLLRLPGLKMASLVQPKRKHNKREETYALLQH